MSNTHRVGASITNLHFAVLETNKKCAVVCTKTKINDLNIKFVLSRLSGNKALKLIYGSQGIDSKTVLLGFRFFVYLSDRKLNVASDLKDFEVIFSCI